LVWLLHGAARTDDRYQADFLLMHCPINAHRKRQSLRFSKHRSLLLACLERIKNREYAIC